MDFLVIKSYNDIIILNFKLKGERNVYKNLMAELAKREMSLEEHFKRNGDQAGNAAVEDGKPSWN